LGAIQTVHIHFKGKFKIDFAPKSKLDVFVRGDWMTDFKERFGKYITPLIPFFLALSTKLLYAVIQPVHFCFVKKLTSTKVMRTRFFFALREHY